MAQKRMPKVGDLIQFLDHEPYKIWSIREHDFLIERSDGNFSIDIESFLMSEFWHSFCIVSEDFNTWLRSTQK